MLSLYSSRHLFQAAITTLLAFSLACFSLLNHQNHMTGAVMVGVGGVEVAIGATEAAGGCTLGAPTVAGCALGGTIGVATMGGGVATAWAGIDRFNNDPNQAGDDVFNSFDPNWDGDRDYAGALFGDWALTGGTAIGAGVGAVGTKWAGKATRGGVSSYSTSQLQHEFKHAGDFGVNGNWNKANGEAFQTAIDSHVSDPATQVIQGSYRNQPATLYYDANTGNVVFTKPDGSFWGGWKLSSAQAQNVTAHGNLR